MLCTYKSVKVTTQNTTRMQVYYATRLIFQSETTLKKIIINKWFPVR